MNFTISKTAAAPTVPGLDQRPAQAAGFRVDPISPGEPILVAIDDLVIRRGDLWISPSGHEYTARGMSICALCGYTLHMTAYTTSGQRAVCMGPAADLKDSLNGWTRK